MKFFLFITLLFGGIAGQAQDCSYVLSGRVIDRVSRAPLSYATLRLVEDKTMGAITDDAGNFNIENLCNGAYHVEISYIGYETEIKYIEIDGSTGIEFELSQHDEILSEIVVHGEKDEITTEVHNVVSEDKIRTEGNKSLADVIEGVSGVSVLKTGSGVSKPMIHGLYGNRITILNNGIAQAGQQWGNDHAPEIDPFVADHISVVKGAAALQYGGNSLGGVVMVDPYKISKDPHLHGKSTYVFQSNGLGHTINTQIEKADTWASWRLSGTAKYMGDNRTPDYFLTNTGKREANIAVQLEKQMRENWNTSAYYSLFNTNIGILRGSHISNLSDLEEAIGRDEPFFTKDKFSYQIASPHQKVNHHLLKLKSELMMDDNKYLTVQYGGQLDKRNEFDVRRNGRSEIPAMSLRLYSHSLSGTYEINHDEGDNLKLGVLTNFTDNTNSPGTGILPLIPDYRSFNASGFAIWQKKKNEWLYEAGTRYDYKNIRVWSISRSVPRVVEHHHHLFHNLALNAGVKYQFRSPLKLSLNTGYVQRSPEVNELYSYGLHQGVSGIEEGSPDLEAENSIKTVLAANWQLKGRLSLQALGYFQLVNDFIFLEPQEDFRLTIRGAYPVFIYKQTDARISGGDLTVHYEVSKPIKINLAYAFVRGQDISHNVPLINMPSDNISSGITLFPKDGKNMTDKTISIKGKYVFEQTRLLPEQDFLAPPDGFFLLSAEIGSIIHLKQTHVNLTLKAENLLNVTYRDYLNRMRYFADEPGRNFSVSVNYTF
ncbi:MAG: TonB-dependent receptor [Bacteroidota bacterium]